MQNILGIIICLICLTAVSTQAQAAEQNLEPAQVFRDCPDCPEMAVIPAGDFMRMWKNGSAYDRVTINYSFALGKTEITQGQWRAIMGNNPSKFVKCGDNCPVEYVSWRDAQDFIQKLNAKTGKQYRLPSEAEWQYACHAGKQETYCGSNDVNSVAWYSSNSGHIAHPVATKQANAWGLFDMSGSLFEWVEDSWYRNPKGSPLDGSAWLGDDAYHVVRGGALNDAARNVTSTNRNYYGSDGRGGNVGFRVARKLP